MTPDEANAASRPGFPPGRYGIAQWISLRFNVSLVTALEHADALIPVLGQCGWDRPPAPPQAVQVAAVGAPPLTPEGQDATRLVAAVVALLDEYMPRYPDDHRRRDPSGNARSGWVDVVPKWRELAEAVSATPPQAQARTPSAASAAAAPEGTKTRDRSCGWKECGMSREDVWAIEDQRDAAIARAERAEKEVADLKEEIDVMAEVRDAMAEEISVLRQYGNKDCTAMADAVLAVSRDRGRLR